MNKLMPNKYMLMPAMGILYLPKSVLAQEKKEYLLLETLPFVGAQGTSVELPQYLMGVFNLAIAVVGIAALLMIIIGGIWYVLSAGNASQTGRAKSMIFSALLGLITALGAWLLLTTINPNLTQYQFTGFDYDASVVPSE